MNASAREVSALYPFGRFKTILACTQTCLLIMCSVMYDVQSETRAMLCGTVSPRLDDRC